MNNIEVMKKALAYITQTGFQTGTNEVIYALRDAIAKAEDVPNTEGAIVNGALYTAPPAAPVQDDFKAWYEEAMIASNEAGFAGMSAAETIRELDRMVSAQPAVPDALNPRDENPAYAAGWNDCRAEMLKGMKP